jgi:hypothetical protein
MHWREPARWIPEGMFLEQLTRVHERKATSFFILVVIICKSAREMDRLIVLHWSGNMDGLQRGVLSLFHNSRDARVRQFLSKENPFFVRRVCTIAFCPDCILTASAIHGFEPVRKILRRWSKID